MKSGPRKFASKVFQAFLILSVAIGMSACKEMLYGDLDAREANQITTLLTAEKISVDRKIDNDGRVGIFVAAADVAVAAALLESHGLPKKTYRSMGEIFSSDGLVDTPFEEHVRYVYALEEKLTEQIVSVSGIRDARVTLSLPQGQRSPRRPSAAEPATASIIVHHDASFDVADALPKLKTVIAGAVAGLDYENVSLVTFPVGGVDLQRRLSGSATAQTGQQGPALLLAPAGNVRTYLTVLILIAVFAFLARSLARHFGLRWSRR